MMETVVDPKTIDGLSWNGQLAASVYFILRNQAFKSPSAPSKRWTLIHSAQMEAPKKPKRVVLCRLLIILLTYFLQ